MALKGDSRPRVGWADVVTVAVGEILLNLGRPNTSKTQCQSSKHPKHVKTGFLQLDSNPSRPPPKTKLNHRLPEAAPLTFPAPGTGTVAPGPEQGLGFGLRVSRARLCESRRQAPLVAGEANPRTPLSEHASRPRCICFIAFNFCGLNTTRSGAGTKPTPSQRLGPTLHLQRSFRPGAEVATWALATVNTASGPLPGSPRCQGYTRGLGFRV